VTSIGSNSVGYKAIGKIKQVLKAAAEKIAQVFTAREPSREALNAYRQRVVTNNQPNMFRKLPDNIIKPDSAVPPEVKRIEELKGVKDRGRRQSRSVSHVDLSR
jgi:hypothetical protein